MNRDTLLRNGQMTGADTLTKGQWPLAPFDELTKYNDLNCNLYKLEGQLKPGSVQYFASIVTCSDVTK